jgi:tRNA nucleotidyltransferase (CCA-adding enzyme)
MKTLIEKLKEIVAALQTIVGCRPVSVGGSVRDAIILTGADKILEGFEKYTKDFDLEVFVASSAIVYATLQKAGIELELVGRNFPVYKVKGYAIDISFPRRENKTGEGHTDFSIVIDAKMSFTEAALRRDFRCNAIGYDWNSKTILDPHLGTTDITHKVLSNVSGKFSEDALRALRCFKFIARLGFTPTFNVISLCKLGLVDELRGYAKERLLPEWIDFILNAKPENIRKAMEFLNESRLSDAVFHEIGELEDVPQQPEHHPEGSVFNHTVHCLEYFAQNVRSKLKDDTERLIVGFAVLVHDLGKIDCTTTGDDGHISAIGHENSTLPRKFLERLFDPADDRIRQIELLVKAHMRPVMLHKQNASMPAIRRLNVFVEGRLDRLMAVVECDQGGRPPKPIKSEAITWVLDKAKELNLDTTSVIKPIILGRHIISHLHLKPGAIFKPILDDMFEQQLDGKFNDEATGIDYLISRYRA